MRLQLTRDGWLWSCPRSWADPEGQRLETMLREVATCHRAETIRAWVTRVEAHATTFLT